MPLAACWLLKTACPAAALAFDYDPALLSCRCTKLTRLAILAVGGEAGSQLLAFGALPAGVSALAGLQQLTLVNAGVTDLPLEISTLRSLKILEVLQSRVTRAQRYDAYAVPIPLPPLPKLAVPTGTLAPLPALTRLALSSAEAPAAAFAALALEALWLDQVQTMTPHNGGAPSPLAAVSSLTVLTELRLSKATLQDVDYAAVAARGSALDCLQLDGCGLDDLPSPLEPLLPQLLTLDLSRNELRAAPDAISMLDCKVACQCQSDCIFACVIPMHSRRPGTCATAAALPADHRPRGAAGMSPCLLSTLCAIHCSPRDRVIQPEYMLQEHSAPITQRSHHTALPATLHSGPLMCTCQVSKCVFLHPLL